MTSALFWNTIEQARKSAGSADEMPPWLIQHLGGLEESSIVGFQAQLREAMDVSYDARLWLAAVVMMNGCGDDSFDYFRAWLIAQGREVFEVALNDPESLNSIASIDGEYKRPRLERLLYVGVKGFLKRRGSDEVELRDEFHSMLPPRQRAALRNQELLALNEDQARDYFPKLAGRFSPPNRQ